MRITSPLAPAAAAFRRPTTPGTGRPSLQVAWARFMMYTWLVTSSQVFRGPTPIMENNSRPSLRLATALPETAAGMGGSFFSSAPSTVAAQNIKTIRNGDFFIAEILPHLAVFKFGRQNQLFRTRFCGGTRGRRRQMQLRGPGLRGARAGSA